MLPKSHLLHSSWQLRPWVPPAAVSSVAGEERGSKLCARTCQEQGEPSFPFSLPGSCTTGTARATLGCPGSVAGEAGDLAHLVLWGCARQAWAVSVPSSQPNILEAEKSCLMVSACPFRW